MLDWLKLTIRLLMAAARSWSNDRAVRLGAGLAYYSLFALVPVLFLAVSLASIFFGQDTVSGEIETAIAEVVGPDLARLVTSAIDTLQEDSAASLAPILSLGVLLFTATLLFVAWKDVVSLIWDLPRRRGVKAKLGRRLFGVAAVLGAGVLLTLVLLAEALIANLDRLVGLEAVGTLLKITGSIVPAVLGAVFIAILFKETPNIQIAWKSVWLSAVITMTMLAVGAWGYGLYLDLYGFESAVGVAGTALLGLAFVYYAGQILLYGVEIVKQKHTSL